MIRWLVALVTPKPRPWPTDPLKAYERGYRLGRQAGRNEVQIERAKSLHRQVEVVKDSPIEGQGDCPCASHPDGGHYPSCPITLAANSAAPGHKGTPS